MSLAMEPKREPIQSYRELIVWQKAIELVAAVYSITADFPRTEVYGLAAQMRRSAVSVPSNIAEGQGRASRGQFMQFLGKLADLCTNSKPKL